MVKKKWRKGKFQHSYNFICGKWEFRFNVVTTKFEYRTLVNGRPPKDKPWLPYDDRVRDSISVKLTEVIDKDLIPDGRLNSFIQSQEISPNYNPFTEYFENLPVWDEETDYIKKLSETVKVEDSKRFNQVLEKFLVGTLAGLIDDHESNDVCLILQGSQGGGKSRWMRKLVPKEFRFNYFNETNIDTRDKDHILWLSQYWYIHLDELESFNSNSISAIKSFITRRHISLRKAYGRYSSNHIRRASFLGSVNNERFLKDTTGNRRWLPFRANKIDYEHDIDINLVWSQVYTLWQKGYEHWFDTDEINELNESNEEFREVESEEELFKKYFDVLDENESGGAWFTSTDVISYIIGENQSYRTMMTPTKMGKILTMLAVTTKKPRNVKHYFLRFNGKNNGEAPSENTITTEKKTKTAEPDDLPF